MRLWGVYFGVAFCRQDSFSLDALWCQLLARMNDVSAFMKALKQRFSVLYNRSHQRYGTLWADRFKSILS